MMGGGDLQRDHRYFRLRGETLAGEVVDIPAIKLTDALSGRSWGLVIATVEQPTFQLRSLHPDNATLLATAGDNGHCPGPHAFQNCCGPGVKSTTHVCHLRRLNA